MFNTYKEAHMIKIRVKMTVLFLLFCGAIVNAQDLQKWHADDIYYHSNEKVVHYIEIIEYNDVDEQVENDSSYQDFDNQMSYSARINRFHRDYYGTSIGFNYGYFHDPFLYNGFGFNNGWGFNYGFGYNWGWDPFFNYGWNSPFYFGASPFFGAGFYNPWFSPWGMNQFAWNNPYGMGFGGGFGYNPYFYNSGGFASSPSVSYGPRTFGTSNVSSNSNLNQNGLRVSSERSRSSRNITSEVQSENQLNQKKSGAVGNLTSANRSSTPTSQKKYTVPKNNRSRWQYAKASNQNQKKTEKKSLVNRIEQFLGADTPKSRTNSNPNATNRKNTSTYKPSRSSNTFRSAPRSAPRMNRPSTNSRRPR